MFACSLIIPVILIVVGWLMLKRCPKKINKFYGYRTKRSMKNMDTWKFAHSYCGKLWCRFGSIFLIFSPVVHMVFHYCCKYVATESVDEFLCGIQIVILVASIFFTETALKKNFFADKNRE